jgi:peptide/nickel transport system permease protein
MFRYIVRRLLGVVILLFIISVLTFLTFFVIAPNPAVLACGKACNPQRIADINHKLGLDKPKVTQYTDYTKGIFFGRWYPEQGSPGAIRCNRPCFGFSFHSDQPVWGLIKDRAPATFSIAIGAAVLWLIIGVSIGVISALRKGSLLDRSTMTVALAGVSLPSFFTGLLLLYLFSFQLNLFPNGGYQPLVTPPPGQDHTHWWWIVTHFSTTVQNFPGWVSHLFLPWVTLAFLYAALYARLTRANMLETMSEDYIRTARAKGLTERRVVAKHGLRAALTPIVTIFGLDLGALLGGAILTEQVYSMQGIGKLTINSINETDLPVIVGVTLFAAFFIVFANLVVDVLYAFVDPKVHYS